jgi:hypothetical protein
MMAGRNTKADRFGRDTEQLDGLCDEGVRLFRQPPAMAIAVGAAQLSRVGRLGDVDCV